MWLATLARGAAPPRVRSLSVSEGNSREPVLPDGRASDTIRPMKPRRLLFSILISVITLSFIPSAIPTGAQRKAQTAPRNTTSTRSPRDEALWQRALAIHRRAIVIDTHNDATTPMTNDDYDLSGNPPAPYRTSIERMKQGGLNAEFFSLYIKPWYVQHGGAARRTLDMIDAVYRAVERHPNDLTFATPV